jgi:hypothetical protein
LRQLSASLLSKTAGARVPLGPVDARQVRMSRSRRWRHSHGCGARNPKPHEGDRHRADAGANRSLRPAGTASGLHHPLEPVEKPPPRVPIPQRRGPQMDIASHDGFTYPYSSANQTNNGSNWPIACRRSKLYILLRPRARTRPVFVTCQRFWVIEPRGAIGRRSACGASTTRRSCPERA